MDKFAVLPLVILLSLVTLAQGIVLARGDVIRLHVIANSDSAEDQTLKESVRDQLIEVLKPIFATLDQEAAACWLQYNKEFLRDLAASVVIKNGKDYSVQIKFTVEDYPVRAYGPMVFPHGSYRSLQVVIGEGRGRNWWCLLFPPLCLVEEATHIQEEKGEKVEIRSWFWDTLSGFFKTIFGI